jgi:DNA-binding transcriptional regulator PaaX
LLLIFVSQFRGHEALAAMTLDASLPGSTTTAQSGAVRSLVRYFHRQSPIRGGSLLITIFGDSIAPRGGAVTLGSLISLAQPFGLAERLVRTSVARLASDGWLIARRDGRRSEYRLSPSGQSRFAEATGRIYGEIPSSWDRRWTLLILPPGIGGRRRDVRDELRWLGFGQVSPGVFAHPNWSIEKAREALNSLDGTANALLLKSESEGSEIDRRLVASGWDLGGLMRRYRKFVDIFTPVLEAAALGAATNVHSTATHSDRGVGASSRDAGVGSGNANGAGPCRPGAADSRDVSRAGRDQPGFEGLGDVGGGLTGEAAFIIRTLLIHEYRKIHLQDPLLPPALLPRDWVGAAAYDLSKRLYSMVFFAAERYLSDTASTMTGPLPPADTSAHARFGGLDPLQPL